MKQRLFLLPFLCLILGVHSCKKSASGVANLIETHENDSVHFEVKYAKGFSIQYIEGGALVDVKDPSGEGKHAYHYAFVKRGRKHASIPSRYMLIQTPISRAICMTTPQLSYFLKLNAVDRIVGVNSTHFVHDKSIKNRIKEKKIGRIGMEGNFDSELVLGINPQVILVSPFKRGGYESIKDLGIPLITFLAYKEPDPLGQAEWLKFTAIMLGKEADAKKKFNEIETKYNNLKKLCVHVEKRPGVMSGELRSGNWYVTGGQNYLATQFKDAGANYFLSDNTETGGFDLDFETVYSKGVNVDFWRILNTKSDDFSYDYIKRLDPRYADFKAYKNHRIFYCDQRKKPFYERIPVEPEVVLADLIKIFHPELLPAHKAVYYEMLEK
jgi:iron complex transport system substrate-binding protein